MFILIHNMEAAIVDDQVTLTPIANVSAPNPSHLGVSSIVVTTSGDPAPPEFWKAAATGVKYVVKIERAS